MSAKRPHTNAAVTTVHTGVPNMYDYTRQADILIAAAGVPGIIQPEHVKPGAVVIGAGVSYEGRALIPDVAEECEDVAGLDHAARRRGRPDDDRHVVPQLHRGCRARRGLARLMGARVVDLLAAGPHLLLRVLPARRPTPSKQRSRPRCAELEPLDPSFVSVTYRGGRSSRERTTKLVANLESPNVARRRWRI